ncbi:MAG: hypothetical protein ACXW14_04265 [Burkholderiaceae bacterium]
MDTTVLRSIFTSVLIGTLAACGGSDDSPAPLPPAPAPAPAPPPVDPLAGKRSVQFAEAPLAFNEMAAASVFFGTDDDVQVLASANICSAGNASVTLDGAAVAVGTQLPTGNHVFAGTFNGCGTLFNSTLTGNSSYAYSAPTNILSNITATATASGMRRLATTAAGDAVDWTGTGSGVYTFNEAIANGESTYTATFVAAPGAVVVNNVTGSALTFVSGEFRESSVVNIASSSFLRYSVEYRALTLSVGGATVVLDGAITQTFGANNAITPSGEAMLSVTGTPAARITFNTQGGMAAEALANVPVW